MIFIGVVRHCRTLRRLTTQSAIVIIPVIAMMMSPSSIIFAMPGPYTSSASGNDIGLLKERIKKHNTQ